MTFPDAAIIAARRARALHESGCFRHLPRLYLASVGFKALAPTSVGYAWSRGQEDSTLTLDDTLAHLRDLVASSDLPVGGTRDFDLEDVEKLGVRRVSIGGGFAAVAWGDVARRGQLCWSGRRRERRRSQQAHARLEPGADRAV
ncbi:hypothetical protein CspeluHIS016_0603040 [Cutaneotrichosporon spelunceum]|uniref:Uncharacterized protein n=1 Tax=Cutaneotrichosporon spelunceum TaxID=1672016 RepID=A0AAD3TXS7_9TREE|nr:hypothetical protein CspeluHIS016_0603040 [Cutaneotrichosporon spelunceum]